MWYFPLPHPPPHPPTQSKCFHSKKPSISSPLLHALSSYLFTLFLKPNWKSRTMKVFRASSLQAGNNTKSTSEVGCEQQTHFRSWLLSLRKIAIFGGREATTGNASAVRRLRQKVVARCYPRRLTTALFSRSTY